MKSTSDPLSVVLAGDKPLLTVSDLQRAQTLLAEIGRLEARITYHSTSSLLGRRKLLKGEMFSAPVDAHFEQYQKVPSRDEALANNDAVRRAAKVAAKRFFQAEVRPFIESILNRAIPLVQRGVDKVRDAEAGIAAGLGLAYETSLTVRACQAAVDDLRDQLGEVGGAVYSIGPLRRMLACFGRFGSGATSFTAVGDSIQGGSSGPSLPFQ